MSKCSKAEEKARSSPHNLAFSDLCRLAECYGFEFARQRGSHKRYVHPSGAFMSFQDANGNAKPYQVSQLLEWIEAQESAKEPPS